MKTAHTSTFILIAVAIVIWCSTASLSNYLANDFAREHKRGKSNPSKEAANPAPVKTEDLDLPPEVAKLKESAEKEPRNIELKLELAKELLRVGSEQNEVGYFMAALSNYQEVLNINPKQETALLAIARLCFTQGIVDKAKEYYKRYLEVVPDDLKAKIDYALVLSQLG